MDSLNNTENDSIYITINENNDSNTQHNSDQNTEHNSDSNTEHNSDSNTEHNSDSNINNIELESDKFNSFNSNYSSEENNTTVDDLTASVENITTTDDLTASVDTINEENEILNNYKYSEDYEENIEIVINEFIKLYETYPEISYKLTQTKSNIKFLPSLIKFLKDKNHKLTLNILDEPKICFEKIFNIINNNYMSEYEDSIKEIQLILPNYDKHLIYEALQVNDNNIENAINYLYEN